MEGNLEIIRQSAAWKRICAALDEGIRPHSIILKAEETLHFDCSRLFSWIFLYGKEEAHLFPHEHDIHKWTSPDLILSGDVGTAPGIGRCREIIKELAVKPLESSGRTAVIFSADKLSLPAANSLLKVAEEPPEGSVLIFLSSPDGEIIPTLVSRSWSFSISPCPEGAESMPLPANEAEWVQWFSQNEKRNLQDIIEDLDKWINHSIIIEDYLVAARLESLKMMGSTKRLSKIMLQDLILFEVKEGIPFEYIPGDFW